MENRRRTGKKEGERVCQEPLFAPISSFPYPQGRDQLLARQANFQNRHLLADNRRNPDG